MSGADQSSMTAPGTRLSEARQAQGLATGDVARRLKLSVGQVEALEADRYHDLPGPIFVRGFIRNYAKLVKLDADELLQAAADSLPQAAARPEMPPSRDIPFPNATPRRWPQFAAISAVMVVGLLAVYEFGVNDAPRTVVTAPAVATPAAKTPPAKKKPAPAPSLSTAAAARPSAPASPPEAEAEVEAPVTRQASPAPAATPPVTAAPPVVVSRQERPVHPDEREVRFVFEEESWVEVRDRNDTVIFYQLNASGTVRRVAGLPPLTVVVGNAQGVKMTYAGQPVDLTRHTKIDVARLTLE